jgi:hypothetical protein
MHKSELTAEEQVTNHETEANNLQHNTTDFAVTTL